MRRLHRALAGTDGPGSRAIPAGEFLHPVPLAAVALLAVNDHVLKGSGWLPGWLTGKLSDVMGFVFFPVLCTALVDVALWGAARLGARVDFSLRMWKAWLAIAFTGGLMAAIKLSVPAADAVADALGHIGFPSRIVADPTDLLPLPALVIPWLLARAEVRRVPLGRLEWIERSGADPRAALADVVRAGGDAASVEALAAGIAAGDADAQRTALARLRGLSG